MPICSTCGKDVKTLPQHHTDIHTQPPDMVIEGVLTKFVRSGDDQAIGCPVKDCTNRHTRRSNFMRHLRQDHALNPTTPKSPGKRPLSASIENLSVGAHKKAKTAIKKIGRGFTSMYAHYLSLARFSLSIRNQTQLQKTPSRHVR
jgi:hypothetical protein